jgi:hypothetical protein
MIKKLSDVVMKHGSALAKVGNTIIVLIFVLNLYVFCSSLASLSDLYNLCDDSGTDVIELIEVSQSAETTAGVSLRLINIYSEAKLLNSVSDIPVAGVSSTFYKLRDTEVKALDNEDAKSGTVNLNELATIIDEENDVLSSPYYDSSVIIGSIKLEDRGCTLYDSEPVNINTERLVEIYNTEYETPDWDCKDKINTIAVLWDFLVNQQGVPAENAAGILGNIYVEGCFAMKQGSYECSTNMEQVRDTCRGGKYGYGCVQWTYSRRQQSLLEYYELANEQFPSDFEATMITAECCMIIEELKVYNVFDNIYDATTIEDATGRVAITYENYKNCKDQWSKSGNKYYLVQSSCSGSKRLKYANAIYKYFTEHDL